MSFCHLKFFLFKATVYYLTLNNWLFFKITMNLLKIWHVNNPASINALLKLWDSWQFFLKLREHLCLLHRHSVCVHTHTHPHTPTHTPTHTGLFRPPCTKMPGVNVLQCAWSDTREGFPLSWCGYRRWEFSSPRGFSWLLEDASFPRDHVPLCRMPGDSHNLCSFGQTPWCLFSS